MRSRRCGMELCDGCIDRYMYMSCRHCVYVCERHHCGDIQPVSQPGPVFALPVQSWMCVIFSNINSPNDVTFEWLAYEMDNFVHGGVSTRSLRVYEGRVEFWCDIHVLKYKCDSRECDTVI